MSQNPETLLLLLSGASAAIMILVTVLLSMVGWVLKGLIYEVKSLRKDLTIVQTVLKTDTEFARKLSQAALWFLIASLFVGCATPPAFLFKRTIDKQGIVHYEPSDFARGAAEAAKATGPWGYAGGALALGALTIVGDWLTNRKIKKHIKETEKN